MSDLNYPDKSGDWTVVVETTVNGCEEPDVEDQGEPSRFTDDDSLSPTHSSDSHMEEDVEGPNATEGSEK